MLSLVEGRSSTDNPSLIWHGDGVKIRCGCLIWFLYYTIFNVDLLHLWKICLGLFATKHSYFFKLQEKPNLLSLSTNDNLYQSLFFIYILIVNRLEPTILLCNKSNFQPQTITFINLKISVNHLVSQFRGMFSTIWQNLTCFIIK